MKVHIVFRTVVFSAAFFIMAGVRAEQETIPARICVADSNYLLTLISGYESALDRCRVDEQTQTDKLRGDYETMGKIQKELSELKELYKQNEHNIDVVTEEGLTLYDISQLIGEKEKALVEIQQKFSAVESQLNENRKRILSPFISRRNAIITEYIETLQREKGCLYVLVNTNSLVFYDKELYKDVDFTNAIAALIAEDNRKRDKLNKMNREKLNAGAKKEEVAAV